MAMEKKQLKEIAIWSLILFAFLLIFHIYFPLKSEGNETRKKLVALGQKVEKISNFNSLAYINYIEPIFIETANKINSLLDNYFQQGGVQITEERYQTIKEAVTESKTKIQNTVAPSEETLELKRRIINYYDGYLLNLYDFIGLTKDELSSIKEEKGGLFVKMDSLNQEQKIIGSLLQKIKERYIQQ